MDDIGKSVDVLERFLRDADDPEDFSQEEFDEQMDEMYSEFKDY